MKLTPVCLLGALIACSDHPRSSVAVDAAAIAVDAAAIAVDAATTPPNDGAVADSNDPGGRFLYVSSLGVAFSSFPGRSVLTRTLQVRSAHGATEVPWAAQSDQGWLSVIPTGMTGGSLILTANPTGLQPDHQYVANVQVSSSDSTIRNEQVVRVGLWIGSTDPHVVTMNAFIPYIVADPVYPYVYTNTRSTDITVYDVYSGVPVRTFAAAVAIAGTMAVSSDAATLFVNDVANRRVVALDTRTGAELRRYTWGSIVSSGVGYARPNAHPILMIGNGRVFDVETGVVFASRITDGGGGEDVSFDIDLYSQYAYVQNHGLNPSSLRQYAIDYDVQGSDPMVARLRRGTSGGSYGQGMCVSADGSRVYTANGAPYSFPAFSADSLMQIQDLPGDAYPSNAACGWNGLFFGGNGGTVWGYHLDGTSVGTFPLAADASTLVLSSDNTRIIGSAYPYQFPPSFTIRNAPSP